MNKLLENNKKENKSDNSSEINENLKKYKRNVKELKDNKTKEVLLNQKL